DNEDSRSPRWGEEIRGNTFALSPWPKREGSDKAVVSSVIPSNEKGAVSAAPFCMNGIGEISRG
ncbi:hypothetical protein, partial [Rhizobium sp. J15]|uniref:hypothetical protein n=1 Tax=Rhizobium sp. J15 TaxID=2035450 RepID=UPI001AECC6B7